MGREGGEVREDSERIPARIGIVSTSMIPTPPRESYGGIELLVGELVKELEKIGYRVRLYALDSDLKPRLGVVRGDSEAELAMKAYEDWRDGEIDVVLDWSHQKFTSRHPISRIASMCFWTDAVGLNPVYPSRAVARAFGDGEGRVIYPGIDISRYKFSKSREDWFLFFSRIIPEKGVEKAIAIARASGVRLKVAGHTGRFAYDREYVERVKKLCTGKIEWVGEVSEKEKIDLLSHARGLIFSPVWLESFGIFLVEALASGCPCIVSAECGGPSEQIEHGKSGFKCWSMGDFVWAVMNVDKIDPEECRSRARYFTSERMAKDWDRYIYGELLW
ncbi:MAG: glycosyltransferase [Candidatus Nezhaarchaeales archaeon]